MTLSVSAAPLPANKNNEKGPGFLQGPCGFQIVVLHSLTLPSPKGRGNQVRETASDEDDQLRRRAKPHQTDGPRPTSDRLRRLRHNHVHRHDAAVRRRTSVGRLDPKGVRTTLRAVNVPAEQAGRRIDGWGVDDNCRTRSARIRRKTVDAGEHPSQVCDTTIIGRRQRARDGRRHVRAD